MKKYSAFENFEYFFCLLTASFLSKNISTVSSEARLLGSADETVPLLMYFHCSKLSITIETANLNLLLKINEVIIKQNYKEVCMLEVGDSAPLKVKVFNDTSGEVSLSDILGKPTVIYFYPKDNTPGCTKEACGFRDYNNELKKLGFQVIGVSADSVKSHQNFAEKHKLNFELWSDPEKKLLEAFGALGEKKMFGKTFLGIKRTTFLLDKKGKIIKVWKTVNTATHAQDVLEFAKNYR